MAATGLDFISGTNDDRIEGNVFTDIGGSGISIGKFAPDSATETMAAITLRTRTKSARAIRSETTLSLTGLRKFRARWESSPVIRVTS